MRHRLLLPALLAVAASASGQTTAPGPYTIQASARLVVLDVVVTDKQGNIVPNLTREDFKVTEDGHAERVVSFEGVGAHRVPPNVTVDSTADLKRLAPLAPVNIIVFDESNTLFKDLAYARSQLKSYLASQPAKLESPTELVAVGPSKSTLAARLYAGPAEDRRRARPSRFPVPVAGGELQLAGGALHPYV